ncbi:hypothetical protein [Spirosoma telluris]|uniref:hypothetical protein n=1 Tax=Spirosoma telluris TaxID=2183553 RepID=UPI002FC3D9FC
MTRYEFLKSMGFTGAALMAAMTSCIREEDTVVNALTLAGTTTPTNSTTTSPTTTTTTSGTTTSPTTTTTTTGTDLSTIKNRLLTIDLTSSAAAALKTVGAIWLRAA